MVSLLMRVDNIRMGKVFDSISKLPELLSMTDLFSGIFSINNRVEPGIFSSYHESGITR